MDNRSHVVYSPGGDAPFPDVEAEILASIYAFILESYESQGLACVPEGLEHGEA